MMMTVIVMMEISKMNCVKQSSNFRFISMEFQVISIFIWLRPGLLVFKFCIYLLVRLMLQGMLSLKLSHSLFERTQTPVSWRSVFQQHQTTWKLWHLLNKVKDHAEIVSFQRENKMNNTFLECNNILAKNFFHGKRLHFPLAVWPWEWFWVMDSVQCADFSIQLRIQVRQQNRQKKQRRYLKVVQKKTKDKRQELWDKYQDKGEICKEFLLQWSLFFFSELASTTFSWSPRLSTQWVGMR